MSLFSLEGIHAASRGFNCDKAIRFIRFHRNLNRI